MITEGIIATTAVSGKPHFSAMGPVLDWSEKTIELRPFQPSTTLTNLQQNPVGVFHLIDDATMFSTLVVDNQFEFEYQRTPSAKGFRLVDCIRWFEFEVKRIDLTTNRANITAGITEHGTINPFRGFNRANHAILEAAILATRIDFIPWAHIESEFERLAEIVKKTGGRRQIDAMQDLSRFVSPENDQ